MTTTTIDNLMQLLESAKKQGCRNVKLQLYDDWEAVKKEQTTPSNPVEDYKVDTRFYNTVEFESKIENMEATSHILSKKESDLLIIRVFLSDRDYLLKELGLEDIYQNNH